MQNTTSNFPKPSNENVKEYAPGTPERENLKAEISRLGNLDMDIPCIIGGNEVRTGDTAACIQPHDHARQLARYHKAGTQEVALAIDAAMKSKHEWESLSHTERGPIFLKAAELLSGKYRDRINAATMLNQSKNIYQSEIDAAAELADFWRFNVYYMQKLYEEQPLYSPPGMLNYCEYRPLEGFVFAVSPFNFTSIGGNLSAAPAIMGNTVVWKPASTAVYAAHVIMEILAEAGLPDGVINFVPGPGAVLGKSALSSEHFAGVHFTGSTGVFQSMWRDIGNNIANYRSYPRIVGETGGKDFIVAHESADIEALAVAAIRGAFEYQGQKCSALSRMYVPKSIWPELKDQMISLLNTVKMGPPQDFTNLMNAVIDQSAFNKIGEYIGRAQKASETNIIFGGGSKDTVGFFVEPTVIETSDPRCESMTDEIFGPVLSIYPYAENFDEVLDLCDTTSAYALTGSIFARDRYAVKKAYKKLRYAAGNFYINDKPTGAVVGQQPFGGARGSGTNDKAGSMVNLFRWVSTRTVKENFTPPTDYRYPFMEQQ